MQSHLIKMYIYHTKYLMFKKSSPVSFAASTIEIGVKLQIL